jgi:hypothetical protein
MNHPWFPLTLLAAALWTVIGAHGTRAALRARRSLRLLGDPGIRTEGEVANDARRVGPSYHAPQIRYQAPPLGRPHAPATHTYREVPLNHTSPHALHRGTPVHLRYDPRDPRRTVIIRTAKAYSPTTNLLWCATFTAVGAALGAAVLVRAVLVTG